MPEFHTTCPKCGEPQYCGCGSCSVINKGKVTYEWVDGERIKCGHCGLIMHYENWLDEEARQIKEAGLWPR